MPCIAQYIHLYIVCFIGPGDNDITMQSSTKEHGIQIFECFDDDVRMVSVSAVTDDMVESSDSLALIQGKPAALIILHHDFLRRLQKPYKRATILCLKPTPAMEVEFALAARVIGARVYGESLLGGIVQVLSRFFCGGWSSRRVLTRHFHPLSELDSGTGPDTAVKYSCSDSCIYPNSVELEIILCARDILIRKGLYEALRHRVKACRTPPWIVLLVA